MLMFPTFGTQDIALVLDWVFAIVFPHYNLGSSIMNIYTNYQYINTCERNMYQVTCKMPALSSGSCCMGMLFIVTGNFKHSTKHNHYLGINNSLTINVPLLFTLLKTIGQYNELKLISK